MDLSFKPQQQHNKKQWLGRNSQKWYKLFWLYWRKCLDKVPLRWLVMEKYDWISEDSVVYLRLALTLYLWKEVIAKISKSFLGIKRDEKIARKMLKLGKKNDFTKEEGKSWIQIMNETDELPPYDFIVWIWCVISFLNILWVCAFKLI